MYAKHFYKMIKMLLMASLIKFGFKCASVNDISYIIQKRERNQHFMNSYFNFLKTEIMADEECISL